jgi:hypothetical protein
MQSIARIRAIGSQVVRLKNFLATYFSTLNGGTVTGLITLSELMTDPQRAGRDYSDGITAGSSFE